MNPDAKLLEALRLAEDIVELWLVNEAECDPARLAELVLALDGWITGGGFLPARWAKKGTPQ